MKKKKWFLVGYGEGAVRLINEVEFGSKLPPPEFSAYLTNFGAALKGGFVFALLLPLIASNDLIRDSILGLPTVVDLTRILPFFKIICNALGFTEVFGLWYLVMLLAGIVFQIYAFVTFPFRTLVAMSRRIVRIRDIFLGLCAGVLMSALLINLFINPSRYCEAGHLIYGHGNQILQLMTTTPIGLLIFGPFFWVVIVLIGSVTWFLAMCLINRCIPRNSN